MSDDPQASVFVQDLHEGVQKEQLYMEFSKFGKLKKMNHYAQKHSARIVYEDVESAQNAIRNMNHIQILKKEIVVSRTYEKDELIAKKKYNIFLKNVPEELETKHLHSYLQSHFGEIATLILRKNDNNKNKGYGYLQFENKESYDKILNFQEMEGKLSLPNTEYSFCVAPFDEKEKERLRKNKIHIRGFFELPVEEEQRSDKLRFIQSVLNDLNSTVVNSQSGSTSFNTFTDFNASKKNFWAIIEYTAQNEESEEIIYMETKKKIHENFRFSDGSFPEVSYISASINERNLIFKGLKENVTEETIILWIKEHINIELQSHQVKILPKSQKAGVIVSVPKATVLFDKKRDGENLLIFAAKKANHEAIAKIFEDKHKITLNLHKDDQQKVNSYVTKIKEFYQQKVINQKLGNVHANIPHSVPQNMFQQFQQYSRPGMQQPFNFPQNFQGIPPQMYTLPIRGPLPAQAGRPAQTITPAPPAPAKPLPAKQENIFVQYQALSPEEKQKKVNHYASHINTHKADFDQLQDKTKFLGQIIYYKINNLDEVKDTTQFEFFKDQTPEQAQALLLTFKKEAARITPMLIDQEVFEIDDIIDIINSTNELIERCSEAMELLSTPQ